MIGVSFKIKQPNLTVKMPDDSGFWKRVALELRRKIRHRTETKKVDWRGMSFKRYSDSYAEARVKAGRSITPNLSFTSKMLASMKEIGKKTRAIVRLSGNEGFKAWVNEPDRIFFAISQQEADQINKQVADYTAKKNNLKKR